jgi:hypothetical protein
MDHTYGPGQWSAQGYEESSGGLTVKSLKVTLPPGRTEGQPGDLNIDSIFIKKLLPKNRLEEILPLADWRNQPGTALAEAVQLKGLSGRENRPEGDIEIKIEEMDLAGLKLAQSAAGAPAGADGFLKALRLDSLSYKNFHLAVKSQDAEATAAVDSAAFGGLSFGGDAPALPELAGLETYAFLKYMAALSLKSLKATGLKIDFQGRAPEAPLQGHLSLASLEETDLQPFKSVGAFKLTGLQSSLTDGQGQNYSLNLAGFSLKGLDITDYLGKIMAGLAAVRDNPERADDLITGQFTLADLFVSPVSLEETALTGLELDLAGLASVKLAEMKATGPYRTGEIPASAKSWLKGLEINLSGDPQAEKGTPGRDIHDLSQVLGRNAFTLEAETETAYEAKTGQFTTKLNRLATKDLFDLSLSQTWGGLTKDRLEKFKNIPLNALFLAALNPGDLLGDASFNAFNLKYIDRGLVDLVFDLKAKEEGLTGAQLKQRTMAETEMGLAVVGTLYLKNIGDLSRPLLDFLKSPQSLEIDLKAVPPLNFAAAKELGAAPLAVLDALNITVSANGQAGSPLRFVRPDAGK